MVASCPPLRWKRAKLRQCSPSPDRGLHIFCRNSSFAAFTCFRFFFFSHGKPVLPSLGSAELRTTRCLAATDRSTTTPRGISFRVDEEPDETTTSGRAGKGSAEG
uniref:Uncharacterized protein n=1 Tax=Compsopogon caeruleus TaxID=31354 RepID=A0A7S1XD23_9RHOD